MTKKKRIDVMVDLETLGTGIDAVVFQIAAAGFDIETGKTLSEFNEFADISKLEKEDGTIDGGTLKWWLSTNKELFSVLINQGDAITARGIFEEFHKWLLKLQNDYERVYLWGNGILFDNAIIRHKLENYGLGYPIFFRNDRDVRTIFELAQINTGETAQEMYDRIYNKELVAHDALNDVINQITLVTECYKILTEGSRYFDNQTNWTH